MEQILSTIRQTQVEIDRQGQILGRIRSDASSNTISIP